MSSFNTSTKKETFSMKIKAQNIKNAQEETQKLELESRKMEERLRELKVAMGREKEQREKKGGFWKKGQTGSLNSYATDVLEKQKPKEIKKRSVKLLRNEKIVLPERSGEPGTMKYIANSQVLNTYRDKAKILKCGQCEERAASMSCVQCAEYFCAGCFAAFHFKGALKRHRTVPLHASGPRQCMSPRFDPQPRSPRHGSEASAVSSIIHQDTARNSSMGASGSIGKSSLLTGEFDEDESAASFQSALQAWRSGDSLVTSPDRKRVLPTTSPKRPVSRVKTPIVKTECSTSTQEVNQPIEIKFTNNNLSYAERLMLKKHRRTDVGHITTPRSNSSANEDEEMDIREGGIDEHVDFHSLYEAMVPSNTTTPNSQRITESSLSIIELDTLPKKKYKNYDQTASYQVEEVDDMTAWKIQHDQSSKSITSEMVNSTARPASASNNTKRCPSNDVKDSHAKSQKKSCLDAECLSDPITDSFIQEARAAKTKSNVSRQVSAKSRPASTRPKSSRSRPVSRAKSRAMSRLQFDGLLTKSPTSALQDVAKMAVEKPDISDYQYRSVLNDYFTDASDDGGVSQPNKAATPRPGSLRKQDIKVSYALYQMAPRSWRPESSLGETLSADTVVPELSDTVLACLGDAATPTEEKSINRKSESVLSFTYSDHLKHEDREDYHEGYNHRSHKHRPQISARRQKSALNDEPLQRENSEYTTLPITVDEITCNTNLQSGRKSKNIVLEGEDYSMYDQIDYREQTQDDQETLDKLEWELASESGRITADGQISRLSWKNDSSRSSSRSSSVIRNSRDQGYDINTRLRDDELIDSDEDNKMTDREDVLALR
ncbi:uncharacterized protein LOC126822866 [Patella vulgata]|uniref:uncharacterized protein LOC126822866 n=1 Tax=Patella vulgata TaxID=6465 RepID=UPI00217FB220|nr:uncharacterized protein LOC126822866 [Patella vulgata]XP_050407792.1 uncharacterized protein LOC126822866 [Patella vulgata]